jgi:hypothetical protein
VPDEALWNCWYGAERWRREFEPAEQRKLIAALDDAVLKAELGQQMDEVNRLYVRGDFAQAEQLADGIWQKLGKEQPQPGLNLSNGAERAAVMCGQMVAGYQALRALDPRHPVWMNHAPRNQIAQLAAFDEGADIVGCDIYPAPAYLGGHSDLADRSLASAGAYTVRMQDAAPGKPVWMVLQGFGWADLSETPVDAQGREKGRRPTLAESRFMAYDTIVKGARGILYWGTAYIEKDSQLWSDLLTLARELADRQNVWSAPDAEIQPEVTLAEAMGSLDRSVTVLGKNVNGKIWWLVVNETPYSLQYTLHGLESLDGTRYSDTAADREGVVANGALTLGIDGSGVQVLEPNP